MNKIQLSQNLLKYSYGLTVLLIGLDKLLGTNLITEWEAYVSPFVANMLPISVPLFLMIMAIIEIAVGILLLTKWTRLLAYVAAVWLVLISINLLMMGLVDIAARDILLAVGAVVLGLLTESLTENKTQF